jgi:hypothetical protein
MEALGGDQRWADRFVAQHAAVFYYFVLMALWLGSPTLAYNFSELASRGCCTGRGRAVWFGERARQK